MQKNPDAAITWIYQRRERLEENRKKERRERHKKRVQRKYGKTAKGYPLNVDLMEVSYLSILFCCSKSYLIFLSFSAFFLSFFSLSFNSLFVGVDSSIFLFSFLFLSIYGQFFQVLAKKLGFEEELVAESLRQTDNDQERAVDLLTSQIDLIRAAVEHSRPYRIKEEVRKEKKRKNKI